MARQGLTEDDILIVTGDFGYDWNSRYILEWMKLNHQYTVLFCDGNHENFDILNRLQTVRRFGDRVGRFDSNTFRLLSGHMYDIQGKKVFVFGGAASIDKDMRVPGESWWPEEIPSRKTFETARRTLRENSWSFDIFLTHTCNPETKKKVLGRYVQDFHDPTEEMIQALEEDIRTNGGSYGEHFFGHFHEEADFGKKHCIYQRVISIE